MPYLARVLTSSTMYRSKMKAVPRQSFVIHPNGGWWQSNVMAVSQILSMLQISLIKRFKSRASSVSYHIISYHYTAS
jgi:hypothetical protein